LKNWKNNHYLPVSMAGIMFLLSVSVISTAQLRPARETTILSVEHKPADKALITGHIKGGEKSSPDGTTYDIDSRSMRLNGNPWMPVMGEFHYSRYPAEYWEEAILAMKAGGVDIVATYVFWIFHEEVRNRYLWEGNMDLRHFLELCHKLDMPVWLRIGPWAHGESRNGGFPDWLYTVCKPRTMDPAYFREVDKWYEAVASQAKGFMHKEGGPVIGIQLDNEFGHVGGQGGDAYILQCKALAIKHGFDVPYYSVCGWGGAFVPQDEVIPVQAAYVDPFWGMAPMWRSHVDRMPHPPELVFSDFGEMIARSQVGGDVARDLPVQFQLKYDFNRYPLAMAELGCDMLPTYGRRPLLTVNDNYGNALCRLGEGANLIGYYMYHGGSHPFGENGSLVEASDTRNDGFAQVSYDFGVLSESGKRKESFNPIKRLHWFIRNFGETLIPMTPTLPANPPEPGDPDQLRYIIRSDGNSGFLFFNNYQRYLEMPDRENIRFSIRLNGQEIVFPHDPIDIPSGAMGIFPINMRVGSATVVYATLQPMMNLSRDTEPVFVFHTIPGIRPEIRIKGIKALSQLTGTYSTDADQYTLFPAPDHEIVMEQIDGKTLRLLVLSDKTSLDSWEIMVSGKKHLAICEDEIWQNGNQLTLRSMRLTDKEFILYPSASGDKTSGYKTIQISYPASGEIPVRFNPIAEMRINPDGVWDESHPSVWTIETGHIDWDTLSDVIMTVDYTGDVARLYLNGEIIADNLWREPQWQFSLKKWEKQTESARSKTHPGN
jgi:beta-galactosidase